MIAEMVDKLIDRAIGLVREHKAVRRALHDDYVAPLIAQFDEVHRNYLTTFRKYREMIATGETNFSASDPVFQEIKNDSLFSGDVRAKLGAFWQGLDHRDNADSITALLSAIFRYLASGTDYPFDCNAPRHSFLFELEHIASVAKEDEAERGNTGRGHACSVLDEAVGNLQHSYGRVQKAYQQVKAECIR